MVQILGFDTAQSVRTPTDLEDFHIMPAFFGAGGKGFGGFIQIVVGSVLIAAGVLLAPHVSPFIAQTLIGMGASMVLGGLLSFIAPQPSRDTNNTSDPEGSKYLGANQNTTLVGTRIPIGYGRFRCYGHFLSFQVDAKDVAIDGDDD